MGKVAGVLVLAHRAAWAVAHGAWPDAEIDHVNHNRRDNRLENLRAVSRRQNAMNASLRSDNTSGVVGVTWQPSRGKWAAQIGVKGRVVPLGRYAHLEDAVHARRTAEVAHGFHQNHGSLPTEVPRGG